MSNVLYRHFDQKGDLLYIGISLSSIHRLASHLRHSEWALEIRTVVLERFASRREALIAEERAIKSENPKFNRVHMNGYKRVRRSVDEQVAHIRKEIKARYDAGLSREEIGRGFGLSKKMIKLLIKSVNSQEQI